MSREIYGYHCPSKMSLKPATNKMINNEDVPENKDDIHRFHEYRNALAVQENDTDFVSRLNDHYNKFSKSYDKIHEAIGYSGPRVIADAAGKFVVNKDARILDIAAGSGNVGEELQRLGFTNKDALEPSQGMREVAASKYIYKHNINDFVLPGRRTKVLDGAYDVIVCGAGFCPGHMTHAMLPKITRMVKPGGYIIFNISKKYLKMDGFHGKFECAVQNLLMESSWSMVTLEVKPYMPNEECIVYVVQKCND